MQTKMSRKAYIKQLASGQIDADIQKVYNYATAKGKSGFTIADLVWDLGMPEKTSSARCSDLRELGCLEVGQRTKGKNTIHCIVLDAKKQKRLAKDYKRYRAKLARNNIVNKYSEFFPPALVFQLKNVKL